MTETLYRRSLPAEAIAFASPEGRVVFREALESGGLAGYFRLAEQFHTSPIRRFAAWARSWWR